MVGEPGGHSPSVKGAVMHPNGTVLGVAAALLIAGHQDRTRHREATDPPNRIAALLTSRKLSEH
jgi:hypothetical protein